MQIHDRNHCGVQIIKGKHGDFHFNQHKKDGTKMPAAAVIGTDAVHFLVSSTLVSAQMDEYDLISTLRQEPCEIFVSDLTGLKLPAHAEIILEGYIDPRRYARRRRPSASIPGTTPAPRVKNGPSRYCMFSAYSDARNPYSGVLPWENPSRTRT